MPNIGRYAIILSVSFFAGLILISTLRQKKSTVPKIPEYSDTRGGDTTVGDTTRELVFVYVTSPHCGACKSPEHVNNVKRAKERVNRIVDSLDIKYKAMGISVGDGINESISHISKFGKFSEINVGNGWKNVGTVRYIWEGLPSPPRIPQISILSRSYDLMDSYVRIKNERVVLRLVGRGEIGNWAKNGMLILPNREKRN